MSTDKRILEQLQDLTLQGVGPDGRPRGIATDGFGRLKLSSSGADWRTRAVYQGYGGHVTIGAVTTPIVGGGNGTVYDLEQPEGVLNVDAGYTMIPLRLTVQCQVPLLASDSDESEILIAADVIAKCAMAGTHTDEGVFNMLTRGLTPAAGASQVPGLSAGSAFTGDNATPTLGMELDRSVITGDVQGTPASALWTPLGLLYEPITPPFIVGPASIFLFWGGTVATSGFAECEVLCIPNDRLAELF